MLRLEQVNGKNVWDILKLTVEENQKNFVANNDISIIEAYTAITANGYAFPFGIYEDEKSASEAEAALKEDPRTSGCQIIPSVLI